MKKREDHGIATLLDLHEQIIDQTGGYWIKIEAWRIPSTADIPHGNRMPYDHRHRHASDKGVPYEFQDAQKLLTDFFSEVDRVLMEIKES